MNVMKALLVAGALMFASNASAILVLSVVPNENIAKPGDSVSVDFVIDGLDAGTPNSLGAFDITII